MHWHFEYTVIVLLVPVYLGCTIYGAMLRNEMTNKLNAVLPKEKQFDWLGWGPSKSAHFTEEYRRNFPRDCLKWTSWLFSLVGISALAMIFTLLAHAGAS